MMQTTPVKRQATHNGILPSTPSSVFNDSDNTRGQMANYTPEHLKAALASRPRSVRSSVSQGYTTSPRTPLSATRSEPLITSNSHNGSPLYSPSSLAQLQYNRGLMPLCDTILDYSPSSSPHSRLSYDHSKNSILSKAQDALASYSARSSTSTGSSAGSSARKRSQVDEDENDEEEDAQMALGMAAHGSFAMQEDSDMTMIAQEMDEEDEVNDVPLSHSRSARRLNGSSMNTFNNNPFGSTTNQSFHTQSPISPLSFTSSPNNNNNAQCATYGNGVFAMATAIGGTNQSPLAQARRQLKTLPKRSNAAAAGLGLNRTQSLPNESFFGNINANGNGMIGCEMNGEPVTAAQNMQIFPRDAFNATDF